MPERTNSNSVIKDRIYGEVILDDPTVIALVKSRPLSRIQRVAQFGLPNRYYHLDGYSRFDHSIGVMHLLKILGASREEQIAGLLHDVSHTAFSHLVDWVVGSREDEDYQDRRHKEFIKDPELSEILRSNGWNPERVLNLENFHLLDTEIPNLCADRIDYALREPIFTNKQVRWCVSSLRIVDGKVVFRDKAPALLFANKFLLSQMYHWGGYEATARFHIFASILQKAIDIKVIDFEDLFVDDDFVLEKLEKSEDTEIQGRLALLSQKFLGNLPRGSEKAIKKFRYVDPEFISDGGLRRLSQDDEDFARRLAEMRKINQEGILLPQI